MKIHKGNTWKGKVTTKYKIVLKRFPPVPEKNENSIKNEIQKCYRFSYLSGWFAYLPCSGRFYAIRPL